MEREPPRTPEEQRSQGPAKRGGLEDQGKPHGLPVECAKTKCCLPGCRAKVRGAWHRAQRPARGRPL